MFEWFKKLWPAPPQQNQLFKPVDAYGALDNKESKNATRLHFYDILPVELAKYLADFLTLDEILKFNSTSRTLKKLFDLKQVLFVYPSKLNPIIENEFFNNKENFQGKLTERIIKANNIMLHQHKAVNILTGVLGLSVLGLIAPLIYMLASDQDELYSGLYSAAIVIAGAILFGALYEARHFCTVKTSEYYHRHITRNDERMENYRIVDFSFFRIKESNPNLYQTITGLYENKGLKLDEKTWMTNVIRDVACDLKEKDPNRVRINLNQ